MNTRTDLPPQKPARTLPVLYSGPEAMNPAQHGTLRLRHGNDYGFARNVHALPIAAAEMPAAMRSYPIVFVGDDYAPVVLVGIRQSENLFVDADGKWAEPHYVPAYVRRYPFILAGNEGAERLTLCVDRGSDRLTDAPDAEADPLFDGEAPAEVTKRALAFCEEYNTLHNLTRKVIELIARHKLFASRNGKISLANGTSFNLTDFHVIDEAALNALPDADFLELRRAGALPVIYCQLASMNSWTSLIDRGNATGARGAEA